MSEHYWTIAQIAERLEVNPETVRRWLRAGKIRGVYFTRKSGYRVADSELRRLAAEFPGAFPQLEAERREAVAA